MHTRIKVEDKLCKVPREILDLGPKLEFLDLSNNMLESLPDDFYLLTNLKIAFFSNNRFKEFPSILSKCPNLEMVAFRSNQMQHIPEDSFPPNLKWLILTDNLLESIPSSIGNCTKLKKLLLSNNKLNVLPKEISLCKNLELVRICSNNFEKLQVELLTIPKLTWLSFSGNKMKSIDEKYDLVHKYEWSNLHIGNKIGEGSSSIIYESQYQNKSYAIKLYKNEITTDGAFQEEMKNLCYLHNNYHNPHLINIYGKIANHPHQKQGLLMRLLTNVVTLAKPPDFDTCTRDIYPETIFTIYNVLSIVNGILSVCVFIHSVGISHGDLYGHNIMIDPENSCYPFLTDFGASFFYDIHSSTAKYIEKIEVRSFGILLEELLDHCANTNDLLFDKLHRLKERCLSDDLNLRPYFKQIYKYLE